MGRSRSRPAAPACYKRLAACLADAFREDLAPKLWDNIMISIVYTVNIQGTVSGTVNYFYNPILWDGLLKPLLSKALKREVLWSFCCLVLLIY